MYVRAVLASTLFAVVGYAQPAFEWVSLSPAPSPPALSEHLMVTDWFTVYLYGGAASTANINQTWQFDGTNWTQLATSTSPPHRRRHAGAWDLARGRLVVFGGETNGGTPLGDTWEFDGTNWYQMMPATVPPSRRDHCMAYDFASGLVIMFSGAGPSGVLLGDMWAWDGNDWFAFPSAGLPSSRWGAQMVWSQASGGVVMFGGSNNNQGAATPFGSNLTATPISDTWLWTGLSWTPANVVSQSPSARYGMTMAYDDTRSRVVMFGGNDGANYLHETWEYDGATWTQIPASPLPAGRRESQMVYVFGLDRTFMFGGWRGSNLSDTWELKANALWQANQSAASIDLDGSASGSLRGPSRLRIIPGQSGTANLASSLFLPGWDLGFAPGPAVPLGGGAFVVPGGQLVNLDISTFSFINGGGLTNFLPVSPLALPFTASLPLIATAQLVVADPTQSLGFSLSGSAELTVADATYLENFDTTPLSPAFTYPLGWSPVFPTVSWLIWEGSTQTANTGPAGDHTSGVGRYLYAETSSNQLSAFSIDMGTHSLTALSNPTLDFWYQLSGVSVGTLHVEQYDGVNWNSLWSVTGGQGVPWLNARVPLTPMSGSAQLRFTYNSLGSNGDCAIDDVSIGN